MIERGDGSLDLGPARYVQGKELKRAHGYAFMLRDSRALGGGGAAAPSDEPASVSAPVTSCVPPLAEGAIWKTPQQIVLDPFNPSGIPTADFVDAMHHAFSEWESKLTKIAVVSGDDPSICADGVDVDAPDGVNEAMFGFIEEPGVLAVTVVWGIFDGPVADRKIVEADIMFNLHFDWGNATSDVGVFDLWGVGTHEVGHFYGKGHTNTAGATMFPSASPGDTHQRSVLACEAQAICECYDQKAQCAGEGAITPPEFTNPADAGVCGPASGASSPPSGAPRGVASLATGAVLLALVMGS
jgi:hypothetical protein